MVDQDAILLGFLVGVPISAVFFAGLAWGMQLALRSARPGGLLLLSAACRIAMLLGVGFWLTTAESAGWALLGYGLAFFLVRLIAILRARLASPQQPVMLEERDR
ncbi:MAG TPA: ATP synthase subunit I [Spongiibacteraceae bacterium]|nr:ATP synthase subunit I [Spongiibacteraceae bacterium]